MPVQETQGSQSLTLGYGSIVLKDSNTSLSSRFGD